MLQTTHPDIIEPTHKKGRESQARIVQATLTLIELRPFDQLTIAEIMEEAGMAVGSFYRRFKSKEGVLPFVFQAYADLFTDWAKGFADGAQTADEPSDEEEVIRFVVNRTAQLFSQHAGLIRTVHLYTRLHPEMNLPASDRRELSDQIGALLAKDFSKPTAADLRRGQMAMLTMVSVMIEYFLYPDHSPANNADLTAAELESLLGRMMGALKDG